MRDPIDVHRMAEGLNADDVRTAIKARRAGRYDIGTRISKKLLNAVDHSARALPHTNEASAMARHHHESMHELFYILRGSATVTRTILASNNQEEKNSPRQQQQQQVLRETTSTDNSGSSSSTATTVHKVTTGTFLHFAPQEIHGFVVPEDSPDGDLMMVMVGVVPN